jgi:hypothetical protein
LGGTRSAVVVVWLGADMVWVFGLLYVDVLEFMRAGSPMAMCTGEEEWVQGIVVRYIQCRTDNALLFEQRQPWTQRLLHFSFVNKECRRWFFVLPGRFCLSIAPLFTFQTVQRQWLCLCC